MELDLPISTYKRYDANDVECWSRGPSEVLEAVTKDHEGDEVKHVWPNWPPELQDEPRDPRKIPAVPFQVYLARGTGNSSQKPSGFALALMDFFGENLNEFDDSSADGFDGSWRFDIYYKPASNVLACVSHQQREIEWRTRNGVRPAVARSWAETDSINGRNHRGRILIVDSDNLQEGGLLMVSFDPTEYLYPHEYEFWKSAGQGDIDTVKAVRAWSPLVVLFRLKQWYHASGGIWTLDELEWRNQGGVSPVHYPAMDPLARNDAEDDGTHEPGDTVLADQLDAIGSDSESDEEESRIIGSFDKTEFLMHDQQLRGLASESYSDSFGLPVTSVWSLKQSKLRPSFSITLYKSYDMPVVHPKALFSCLNKGMIVDQAWTLDIISNMPSIEAAYEYHKRSSIRRTSFGTAQTRQRTHMIIDKVMGHILPAELLEYIEDMLVPPVIPDYSSRSKRPFQSVFLYLDKHWTTGPSIVYFDPISHDRRWNPDVTDMEFLRNWSFAAGVVEDDILRVALLRYWHRVADEIHILWSLSSHRLLKTVNDSRPYVSLRIDTGGSVVPIRRPEGYSTTAVFDVYLELHNSQHPVTIHQERNLFSHELWEESLNLFDLETGLLILPLPCDEIDRIAPCYDSWSHSKELGLHNRTSAQTPAKTWLTTLSPNSPMRLPQGPSDSWWQARSWRGRMHENHSYALRLKPNVTIPQWTYGNKGNPRGPYNLPPMPVIMEKEVEFMFQLA